MCWGAPASHTHIWGRHFIRLRKATGALGWGQEALHPKVSHAQIARNDGCRREKPRGPDQDLQGLQAQGTAPGPAQASHGQKPLGKKPAIRRAFCFAIPFFNAASTHLGIGIVSSPTEYYGPQFLKDRFQNKPRGIVE